MSRIGKLSYILKTGRFDVRNRPVVQKGTLQANKLFADIKPTINDTGNRNPIKGMMPWLPYIKK